MSSSNNIELEYEQKKKAEKCLSRLLDYSKNVKRNCSKPQNILRENLKKDVGYRNKSHRAHPHPSFDSIQSNEINKFMNKIFFDSNDSESANIVMLNRDEFIRLKAGGCGNSKEKKETINKTNNIISNTEKESSNVEINDNQTQTYTDIINMYRTKPELDRQFESNNVEERSVQIKIPITSSVHIPTTQEAQPYNNKNKYNIPEEIEFIEPSIKQTRSDKKEGIPSTKSKLKQTILEFDKIMNHQLKKRTVRQFGNIVSPAVKTQRTTEKRSEQPNTVKATVINSAVSGIPNIDRHFSEDYDLMNAIDCFIKAEDACNFQQALQAAEMAAKHAPLGFEEEAATEAARHFKSQYQLKNDIGTSNLEKTKKPIEVVAYVGCT